MEARLPVAPRALVVAVAIPFLFLHSKYQPRVSVGPVDAYLSDFAVLAVVVTAVVVGTREGFEPLRAGRWIWFAVAGFLVWMTFGVAWGHHVAPSYATQTHLVTAAKFAEYALLAPSLVLLLRTRADLLLGAWTLSLWSCLATLVGIAQFFGANIFISGAVGRRQASFLSSADFSALSIGTLLIGFVLVAPRALRWTALVSGTIGMIIAGAIASVLGLVTALIALAILWRDRPRRLVVPLVASLVVLVGAVAIRGKDLDAFSRFLGAHPGAHQERQAHVQTYAHRTLLVWLGWRIWLDHPVLGVGWEGSAEPANFLPHIPAAHRRFPTEAPLAFPSAAPDRRYGVQNSWVQVLADLGVLGLLLWVAVFATPAWRAFRRSFAYPFILLCALLWLWASQGFVAGIPLDALTFFAVGLAARP